jgi:uncharacterized protein
VKAEKQKNRLAQLEEFYGLIPKVQCLGKCQLACGPVGLFPIEAENIKAKGHALPVASEDLVCSKLSVTGTCSIYGDRPLVCRMYGAVSALQCPYGCKSERLLDPEIENGIARKVQDLKAGKLIVNILEN